MQLDVKHAYALMASMQHVTCHANMACCVSEIGSLHDSLQPFPKQGLYGEIQALCMPMHEVTTPFFERLTGAHPRCTGRNLARPVCQCFASPTLAVNSNISGQHDSCLELVSMARHFESPPGACPSMLSALQASQRPIRTQTQGSSILYQEQAVSLFSSVQIQQLAHFIYMGPSSATADKLDLRPASCCIL